MDPDTYSRYKGDMKDYDPFTEFRKQTKEIHAIGSQVTPGGHHGRGCGDGAGCGTDRVVRFP